MCIEQLVRPIVRFSGSNLRIVEHGPDTLFLRVDTLFDVLPERGGLGTNAVDQTRQTSVIRSFGEGVWTGANRCKQEHVDRKRNRLYSRHQCASRMPFDART